MAAERNAIEYWVLRVRRYKKGPLAGHRVRYHDMTLTDQLLTMALVDKGSLCILPDGCLAEPVEGYTLETDADVRREKLARDNPGEDYRVVLTTPLAS